MAYQFDAHKFTNNRLVEKKKKEFRSLCVVKHKHNLTNCCLIRLICRVTTSIKQKLSNI